MKEDLKGLGFKGEEKEEAGIKNEFAKIEQDCSEIGKMLGGIIKHRKGERP